VCAEIPVCRGWLCSVIGNGPEAFDHNLVCPIRSKPTHMQFYNVYTTMRDPYPIWRELPDWTTRVIRIKFAPACRAPCPSWASHPTLTADLVPRPSMRWGMLSAACS
jgi:hypothetical protein